MNTNKLLMTVAAVALIAGSGVALAQQEPTRSTKTQALAKAPNANLTFNTTPEDHSRISAIFAKEPKEPKVDHVSFSLKLGTVVPHSVHLIALPQTVVDIQPTWRGNEYFKVGDQIVIVDSQSKKILGIIDA